MDLIQIKAEEVSVTAPTGRHRYAVIDAAVGLSAGHSYLPDGCVPTRILSGSGEEPDGLPWLVRLEPRDQAWLLGRTIEKEWGILVESTLDMATLSAGLGARLNAVDGGGQGYFLRYFDPRVLEPLLLAMNREEHSRWFVGVEAFGWTQGERIRWLAPGTDAVCGDPGSLTRPLRLRDEHLQAFGEDTDAALLDELRAFIEDQRPGAFDGLSTATTQLMLRGGVARANRHDITSLADVAAFVAIMLDVAPNFDEHPEILACLKLPLLTGGLRLRAAIEMCSDEAWEQAENEADTAAWFGKGDPASEAR